MHARISRTFLLSATKLRRLCFYTCLSFSPQGGSASVHAGIPQPHGTKQTPPPLGPGNPPRDQTTPWDQTPPGTYPPGTRHHPPEQTPPGTDTPRTTPPLPTRRLPLRTVRILLECNHVYRISVTYV